MLERLFARFDALCAKYGLFKAETIGDAFLAVAGIPTHLSDHVARVRSDAAVVTPDLYALRRHLL